MRRVVGGDLPDVRWHRPPLLVRLVVVALATGVAAGLRFAMTPLLGLRIPFFTFYPAIIVCAAHGGLGSGVLCTLAAALLVVADIDMPGEDGYSPMRRASALLASRGRYVPGLALTACVRVRDVEEAARAGFQLHVAKPVLPDQIVGAVARLGATQAAGAP